MIDALLLLLDAAIAAHGYALSVRTLGRLVQLSEVPVSYLSRHEHWELLLYQRCRERGLYDPELRQILQDLAEEGYRAALDEWADESAHAGPPPLRVIPGRALPLPWRRRPRLTVLRGGRP